MKILLVEDDQATASAISEALTLSYYSVDRAEDGETALALAEAFSYDLILLDIIIPKIDGLHVCQHLRSQGYQVPILLLTVKDSSGDRVLGLDTGADDYLVKPFDFAELLARMRALLRRGSATLPPTLAWENLQFNPGTNEFTYAGKPLHLTPKEYGLLELFLLNPSRIFSRSAIIDHLWTSDTFPGEEAVNTHIKTLRQKLKAAGASANFIETVYGIGYRLKPQAEQEAGPPSGSAMEAQAAGIEAAQTEKLAGAMTQLKTQFQSYFLEQLAVLERVTIALNQNSLTSELQQQGKQEAHKLAGSLGIFGFEQGSNLARQLEILLLETPLREMQAKQFSQCFRELQYELQPDAAKEPIVERQEETKPLSSSALAVGTQFRVDRSPQNLVPMLLVIDGDRTLTDLIQLEGENRGFCVAVASDIAAGRQILFAPEETEAALHNRPDIVLLSLPASNPNEAAFDLVKELAYQTPKIPVVVYAADGELDTRVKVAQSGGSAFLQKPMLPGQIFSVIEPLICAQIHKPKVMVVDDDPAALAALTALLKSHHLEVIALENPQQFWKSLIDAAPDLLILDIEMPTFSGIELCRVVRTDPQWANLPILVLTAHQEPEVRYQVAAAGADEYVQKPFDELDLLNRVMSQLERHSSRILGLPKN